MDGSLANLLNVETLIILLLVLAQARDAWVKRDSQDLQHEIKREGFRQGYQCSQEAMRKTVESIAELWQVHNALENKRDRVEHAESNSSDIDRGSEL